MTSSSSSSGGGRRRWRSNNRGEGKENTFFINRAASFVADALGPAPAGKGVDEDEELVWYFAYGSNMKRSVFEGRRKIVSRETKLATIPGRVLSYAYDGLPFLEPCFATCLKREDIPEDRRGDVPDVHGVAYLITTQQLKSCLASEGGNGWNDNNWIGGYLVERVQAVSYDEEPFAAVTLVGYQGQTRGPESHYNCPSKRYLGLVLDGAIASGLNDDYVAWLKTQTPYALPESTPGYLMTAFRLLGFPVFFFYLFLVPLFTHKLGMERPPWTLCVLTQIYNRRIIMPAGKLAAWWTGVHPFESKL